MRARLAATAVAVVVLAGCGGTGRVAVSSGPVVSVAGQAPAMPAACSSVLRAGARVVVDGQGQFSCTDPDGRLYVAGVFRCNDGTHLGSVEPSSGAPRGWFRAPGPYRVVARGQVADDKGYGAAYRKCNS